MAENDPDDLTGLPLQPTPEQLPEAYRLCRKKLAQANWSRSALKGHDDYRGSLISELRADLEDVKNLYKDQIEYLVNAVVASTPVKSSSPSSPWS